MKRMPRISRIASVIRNGRIAEIGPSAQRSIPDGASVVEGTGKYLIPGLFEGTIAPGKVADLVLLDADPLANIDNTRRISAVVLRGKLFRQGDLDALRAAVRAMPDIRTDDWVR